MSLRDRERRKGCRGVCVCVCVRVHMCTGAQSCPTLWRLHGLYPSRILCSWNFLGKNIGAGCHFFLQGIFPTQRLNPHLLCLLHCQAGSLPTEQPSAVYKYIYIHGWPLNTGLNHQGTLIHGFFPIINTTVPYSPRVYSWMWNFQIQRSHVCWGTM